MATKAFYRFKQRLDAYAEDLELCDALVLSFNSIADTTDTIASALGDNGIKYPTLDRSRNVRNSRKKLGLHLKRTLYVGIIKDLYEEFLEFLSETMNRAAQKGVDPRRFVGDAKVDLHARDIMAAGGWDPAVKLISDAIFRNLESERKTRNLIEKVSNRIGLQIDPLLIESAMPYIDARHILVHKDSKADANYIRDYPDVVLKDGKIIVNFAFVSAARTAITALAEHIDERIVALGLVRDHHIHGGGR